MREITISEFRVDADPAARTVRFTGNIEAEYPYGRVWAELEAEAEGKGRAAILLVPVEARTRGSRLDETVEMPTAEGWTPERPLLFRARGRLLVRNQPMIEAETRFGFRQFGVREGFFSLAGKRFPVHGAVLPPSEPSPEAELAALKALGINTAVVGPDRAEEVLEITDRTGLAVLVHDATGVFPPATGETHLELERHPSLLAVMGSVSARFLAVPWVKLAAFRERGQSDPWSSFGTGRPQAGPVLVRLGLPKASESPLCGEVRAVAEALASVRTSGEAAGYCLALPEGESWSERARSALHARESLVAYLPIVNGLSVLFLRTHMKRFPPHETARITISLLNPGRFMGDATLVVSDLGPDKVRRTHRQAVHITESSRAFSSMSLNTPASPGRWEINAALVSAKGETIGRAIPWTVEVTSRRTDR